MMDFHIHFIFQVLVISTIILVVVQIKFADQLDLANRGRKDWLFWWRRATMVLKAGMLCWTVVYSYQNNWAPWPPIMGFLAAFDLHVSTQIFIMRRSIINMNGGGVVTPA